MTAIRKTVEANQGDTVDIICHREYGAESKYVEAVLEANPGLSALGAVLPMGTPVALPDLSVQSDPMQLVSLWD